MKHFTLHIRLSFSHGGSPEIVASLLRDAAAKIAGSGDLSGEIYDADGRLVGEYSASSQKAFAEISE